MKATLTMCTFLLGSSLWLVGQQPATPNTNSTPPTFPTDQQQQAPLPDRPQSTLPPDTSAPQSSQTPSTTPDTSAQSSQTASQSSSASAATNQTLEGCLSQAPAGGGFILTDNSGVQYTLTGSTSDLSSHVGEQVRITGDVTQASASAPSANTDNPEAKGSTSSASSAASMSNQGSISVSKVKKVSGSCSSASSPSPK